MKNLLVIVFAMFLAMACNESLQSEISEMVEHPTHVLTAVEKHLDKAVQEQFLNGITYNSENEIADFEQIGLESFSTLEQFAFFEQLFLAEIRIIDNGIIHESKVDSDLESRFECKVEVLIKHRKPTPSSNCVYTPGFTCVSYPC